MRRGCSDGSSTAAVTTLVVWHWLLPGAMCWLLASSAVSFAAQPPQKSAWSAEVGEALRLYQAGDYTATHQLCVRLHAARDPRVRRDAAALRAMTWTHGSSRSDRLAGLAQLGQLGREDPLLLERPECNLAMGIARAGLLETGVALDHLDTAAEGFQAQQQPERLAAVLTALAETWTRHTEWEVTPPRFGVQLPQTPDDARQVRREQIGRIRTRLEPLPANDDALARVDLLLAQDFIAGGDRVADGYRVLGQIASSPRMTPAVVDAALMLAEHLEQERRWPQALALYRRLTRETETVLARTAERRIARITRPQLLIDVPASVTTDQTVRVALRARNVGAVQVEVRRLDLGAWLEARQGRLAELLLPTAGSLHAAADFTASAAQPYDWWTSDAPESPLEFRAPPGAYVVVAHAAQQSLTAKRLVLVSDLAATLFVGPRAAIIWAAPGRPTADVAKPTARFWMHGSFVPTRPAFAGDLARFNLPAEARVMRDKHWVCLVQAGEHLALCRGELAPADQACSPDTVALVGAPSSPRVGETLTLTGVVLRGDAGGAPFQPAWRLEARDVLDNLAFTYEFEPDPSGVFAVDAPIAERWSDAHLRVTLRRGDEVVENVCGRFGVQVRPLGQPSPIVACRVPAQLDPGASDILGLVQAWYPWGTPLGKALLTCVARDVGLPTAERNEGLLPGKLNFAVRQGGGHSHGGFARADEAGRFAFRVHADGFRFPAGPAAVGLWADFQGWEGAHGSNSAELLLAGEPVHTWLRCEPGAPRVGQDVYLELGWYDPAGQTGVETPSLEVRSNAGPPLQLQLHPELGALRSDTWRPEAAGTFSVVASLPRLEGDPLDVRRTITVSPAEADDADVLRCAAHFAKRDGRAGVLLHLDGQLDQPLAVVVSACDPLAAITLPGVDEATELFLPLETAATGARVIVASGGEHIATEDVQPDPADALEVQIETSATQSLPGTITTVRVTCTRAGQPATDASLLARLVPATGHGLIHWLPGRAAETVPVSNTMSDALLAGETLWTAVASTTVAGTELEIPLPEQPGLYRLLVYARSPVAAEAMAAQTLDTRGGLHLLPEAPTGLTLGDRTLVAVAVENPGAAPVEARVRLDAGDGLSVESLRVPGQAFKPGELVPLRVPADSCVWLQAWVEAVQVGPGVLSAELKLPAGRQHAATQYEVHPAEPPPATGEPLRLTRTVSLLIKDVEQVDSLTGEPSEDGIWRFVWNEAALRPGNLLLPGEHLLVRESLSVPDARTAIEWTQRVPPNCHALLTGSQAEQTIGESDQPRVDILSYSTKTLPSGVHVHEYHLVAVRPGVCLLPAPEIRVAGESVNVAVDPIDLRLNVLSPEDAP